MKEQPTFRTIAGGIYEDLVNQVATHLWGEKPTTDDEQGTCLDMLNIYESMKDIADGIAFKIPLDGVYDVYIDAENHALSKVVPVVMGVASPVAKMRTVQLSHEDIETINAALQFAHDHQLKVVAENRKILGEEVTQEILSNAYRYLDAQSVFDGERDI
jgi:hypothetical protein